MIQVQKKIEGELYIQKDDNPFAVSVNLKTGEVTMKKFLWLGQNSLLVKFNFDNHIYEYPIQSFGGKYFVENYKEQPIFKNVQLFINLKKNLNPNKVKSSKQLKI